MFVVVVVVVGERDRERKKTIAKWWLWKTDTIMIVNGIRFFFAIIRINRTFVIWCCLSICVKIESNVCISSERAAVIDSFVTKVWKNFFRLFNSILWNRIFFLTGIFFSLERKDFFFVHSMSKWIVVVAVVRVCVYVCVCFNQIWVILLLLLVYI